MALVRFGVYSGDPLLVERRLRERLSSLNQPRKVVCFGDEITPSRVLLEAKTADLFGEEKAVVVRRADPLRGERELALALAAGLPHGVAIFFLGEDLRGPLAEAAEEAEHFPRPSGKALRELCEILMREAGLPVHSFVVDLLVEAAGGDTLRLAQEVAKFAIWKGGKLPRSRLPELCFFGQPQPYGFLEVLGERKEALAALSKLLRARWNPQAIFYLVVSHIRALLATLSAHEANASLDDPDWLIRRRLLQARRFGEGKLIQALCLLQELDLRIKLGELSPEDALQLFIWQWAQP